MHNVLSSSRSHVPKGCGDAEESSKGGYQNDAGKQKFTALRSTAYLALNLLSQRKRRSAQLFCIATDTGKEI